MEEVWKDIQGYEGLYQVSNTGKVKSLHYSGGNNEKLLKNSVNSDRRLKVSLYKNHKHKQCLLHRLVAQAFIPNPYNLPDINHIDENPQNNNMENLEWCTCEYNNETYYKNHPEKYSLKYRTIYRLTRDTTDWRKSKIVQKDKAGNIIQIWKNVAQAKTQGGYSSCCIIECCKGNRYNHKGYVWEFLEPQNNTHKKTRKTNDWKGLQILQKDKNGNILSIWADVSTIAKQKNYKGDSIIRCCKGKGKTAYGYIWEFADQTTIIQATNV